MNKILLSVFLLLILFNISLSQVNISPSQANIINVDNYTYYSPYPGVLYDSYADKWSKKDYPKEEEELIEKYSNTMQQIVLIKFNDDKLLEDVVTPIEQFLTSTRERINKKTHDVDTISVENVRRIKENKIYLILKDSLITDTILYKKFENEFNTYHEQGVERIDFKFRIDNIITNGCDIIPLNNSYLIVAKTPFYFYVAIQDFTDLLYKKVEPEKFSINYTAPYTDTIKINHFEVFEMPHTFTANIDETLLRDDPIKSQRLYNAIADLCYKLKINLVMLDLKKEGNIFNKRAEQNVRNFSHFFKSKYFSIGVKGVADDIIKNKNSIIEFFDKFPEFDKRIVIYNVSYLVPQGLQPVAKEELERHIPDFKDSGIEVIYVTDNLSSKPSNELVDTFNTIKYKTIENQTDPIKRRCFTTIIPDPQGIKGAQQKIILMLYELFDPDENFYTPNKSIPNMKRKN